MSAREQIEAGRVALGIELGSTRIKACLIDADAPDQVLATGGFAWENQLVDGLWSYSLDDVKLGVQTAYAELVADAKRAHGADLRQLAGLGVSAMMHGYLAFDADDQLLVPFRTWRNTNTEVAAAKLSDALDMNIPLRWSIAHVYQAVLDDEPHVSQLAFITSLAGYVHWQLTGERVLGVGDASGVFPIASGGSGYDEARLERAKALLAEHAVGFDLAQVLPRTLPAGESAGVLTPEGALWLDPHATLQPGASVCPPEGDAGTGMVATNAVAPRTGNVSAGTSIFAMIVLERELQRTHEAVDLITTPVGDAVAMVHCNNGASELGAWAGVFEEFAARLGASSSSDDVFEALFSAASDTAVHPGGVYAYNQLSGEPVVELDEGRPLVVRTPESELSLGSLMRSQINGVFASLAIGMRILMAENVAVESMFAHGGMFRTSGVAQRVLAMAIDAPVAVGTTASEGGAWGMAVLAAYQPHAQQVPLHQYLNEHVFLNSKTVTETPDPADVAEYARYLDDYQRGLEVVRSAGRSL